MGLKSDKRMILTADGIAAICAGDMKARLTEIERVLRQEFRDAAAANGVQALAARLENPGQLTRLSRFTFDRTMNLALIATRSQPQKEAQVTEVIRVFSQHWQYDTPGWT